jgi:L-rhamnose mutarotase
LATIVQEEAHPYSIDVTDQANTIYVSYHTPDQQAKRALIAIQDHVNRQWTVIARYIAINSEWIKTQSQSPAEPAPLRHYEWEDSVKRWILKSSIDKAVGPQ